MSARFTGWLVLAVAVAAAVLAGPSAAEDRDYRTVIGAQDETVFVAARDVRVEAEVADDLIAAGGWIAVVNSRLEDLIAAGGQIEMTASHAQDAILAGGTITIDGGSLDDLFAAAGTLDIASTVQDDLIVAGGRVRTRAVSRVGGIARIAGGDLGIQGRFAKNLHLAGGAVRLDAEVGGNVEIRGGSITLGPATRIAGVLRYASEDAPTVADGAVITGGIERLPRAGRGIRPDLGDIVGAAIVALLALLAGLAVVALVLQAAIPGILSRAQQHLAEWPWESLGIGIAAVLLTPLFLVLLALTVVGLPLALLVGLVYLVLGAVALVVLAYRVGVWVRARATRAMAEPGGWLPRMLWTLAGLLAVAVVSAVPIVGWAVVLLALAAAFGALLMQSGGVIRERR